MNSFKKALMGFVRPSRGKIRINGIKVNQAQKEQSVAYVPQNEGIDYYFISREKFESHIESNDFIMLKTSEYIR